MPEVKSPDAWGRFVRWLDRYQRIARPVVLAIALLVFLLVVPASIRSVFWEGILSDPLLTAMLLIFSALVISLIWSTGQRIDAWTFLLFNLRGSRPVWLDRVMSGFTQLGNGITALGIAVVFFLAGNRLVAYQLVLGTVTLWLVVELLKFAVHRSRPFLRLAEARIVGSRAIGRSFPSGHTSQIFFMATMIVQHFHLSVWVALLLYAVAFLVGITRMYVGAHYPRDVLAGAILGSAWGLFGAIIDGHIRGAG